MLKQVRKPFSRALRSDSGVWASTSRHSVSVAVGPEHLDLPAGHQSSDMRATACNIGLNRRRDLTLRQDLKLHTSQGAFTLSELLKGKLAVLFGVPDMGKVCSENHVPSFIRKSDRLRGAGVEKIFCITVSQPEKAEKWSKKLQLAEHKIEVLADKNGSFTRSLGVNLEPPESDGPHSQRYAALVEDGILLKLKVEDSLKDVNASSATAMLEVIEYLQSLN